MELGLMTLAKEHVRARTFLGQYVLRFLELLLGEPLYVAQQAGSEFFSEQSRSVLEHAKELKRAGVFESLIMHPPFPDEPREYLCFAKSEGLIMASGNSFDSPDEALARTISEVFERYLWSLPHLIGRSKIGVYSDFKDALAPLSFTGYSKEQREQNANIVRSNCETMRWIEGRSLITHKPQWCPLQLVSLAYIRERNSGTMPQEPLIRGCTSNGIATSESYTIAVTRALLEVIERESFSISHIQRLSPPKLRLSDASRISPKIAKVLEDCERAHLRVELVLLPTDFPTHVVMAIVLDESGKSQALQLGARAHFSLETCVIDALREAISLRIAMRTKIDLTDTDLQKKQPGVFELRRRLMLWEQPESLGTISYLWGGKYVDIPHDIPASTPEKGLRLLVDYIKEIGGQACAIDLAKGSAISSTLNSVMVVAPSLHPIRLTSDPSYLGGERLSEIPKKLGYSTTPNLNDGENPFP